MKNWKQYMIRSNIKIKKVKRNSKGANKKEKKDNGNKMMVTKGTAIILKNIAPKCTWWKWYRERGILTRKANPEVNHKVFIYPVEFRFTSMKKKQIKKLNWKLIWRIQKGFFKIDKKAT